jgi:hypothetical protein
LAGTLAAGAIVLALRERRAGTGGGMATAGLVIAVISIVALAAIIIGDAAAN